MSRIEIAELLKQDGLAYSVAEKLRYDLKLNAEDKDFLSVADQWARHVGNTGADGAHELSQFIQKQLPDELYPTHDELIDLIADRGTVGEFDQVEYSRMHNGLIAHEAAPGGTVDRSFMDMTFAQPFSRFRQVETDISLTDLRRNGFKTVANHVVAAKEKFHNALFYDFFAQVDGLAIGGAQTATGLNPASMKKLSTYLLDRGGECVAVTQNQHAQDIADMAGHTSFMSDEMKSKFNRTGLVDIYRGVRIGAVAGSTIVPGAPLLPDNRVYGVAGKVAKLDMRGDIRVLQQTNIQTEQIHIKITGFSYTFAFLKPENLFKLSVS